MISRMGNRYPRKMSVSRRCVRSLAKALLPPFKAARRSRDKSTPRARTYAPELNLQERWGDALAWDPSPPPPSPYSRSKRFRSSISSRSWLSSFISCSILRMACSTVVWSRLPKLPADFRQRARGQRLGEIHADLPGPHDGAIAPAGQKVAAIDAEMLQHHAKDVVDLDPPAAPPRGSGRARSARRYRASPVRR